MALLQVHKAKALRDLHEGGHDLAVLHELRAETDLALRATKVTAQSLGRAMSTLVVQERHLWLCLADMKEKVSSWMLPCHRPASSATLSRALPSSSRQHRSRLRRSNTSCAGGNLLLPPRLQPLSLLVAVGAPCGRLCSHAAAAAFHQAASWSRSQAGRPARPGPRQTWRQAQVQEALRRATQRGRRLLIGRWWLHLSLPRRRAGWSILFLFRRWPGSQRYPKLHLRAVSSVSGSWEGESCELCITGSLPSSSLARQQVVAQEHPSCPFVEPGKGGSTPVPASSRYTSGCHKPQAGFLCFLPHEEESGECYTTHPDPAPCRHRPGRHRSRAGSLCSTTLPHRGYVCGPLVPLAQGLGAWLALPGPSRWLLRTIRLGYAIQFARRPPKFRGVHFTSMKAVDAPVLCAEIAVLLAKDAIETGPSSRYEVGVLQPLLHCAPEKRWVMTDLGSASFEPCTSQAAVQDDDAETHFRVRPSPRLVCSDRPEGRVLSWLNPTVTQGIPAIRVRGSCMSVQNPAFRHLSQLGFQVNWGKSKLLPMQRISFLGMELDSVNQTARLTQYVLSQCWTASRLYQAGRRFHWNSFRGSWGIWLQLRRSSAQSAPYETASALAPWPSPEVGVEMRYSPGSDYTGLPQDLQPVDRSFVPSGRSTPGTGLQACCGIHGCLGHRLGSHLQRARSVRGMDGSPTALAYQLPRVAGSTPCLEPPQRAPSGQGHSGLYGQHGDRCVYQPARQFTLPSHVANRLPPPPLESEASEVPSCHPHPRSVQPGGWRAVSSGTSWGVETPSPGGPADWSWFGAAQVDLFASPDTTHCQWFYSLTEATLGTDALAHSWPRGLRKYAFPPVSLLAQTLCKIRVGRGAGLVSGSILAQQDLVPRTHAPRDSPSLADSSEEGSAFSETGHPLAPASRLGETPCVVPGRDAEVLGDLPQEVALTIASARAPSTRRAYALKWNLFIEWCSSHREDPRRCSIRAVLSFLQQGLERRLSPSTLKVYVAAISAHHDPIEGRSVGKHDLVVRFLRGARRLNPPRPPSLTLLGFGIGAKSPTNCPLWAFAVSRVEVSLYENPTPDCVGLDQEGGGPAGIFGRWIVLWVWAGWLQCNTETPARLCAQGSYHSLQGPGGEPASAAPGGGRPSPSFALSCTCIATVRG